jgi:MFS family permease
MTDTSTFASLKVRDYAYLWVGMLGSAFSLNMQLVAQGWLVYEMTVSAMNLAWVTLAFMLPQVLFSLLGGVLADRVAKKPVLFWCQLFNGVSTLFMAGIVLAGHVTFFDFLWVGFINGTLLALSIPARTAFIPELVGEKLMFNAMAFNTAAWNLSRILGPALAGYMIALFAGGDTTSEFGVGMVYIVLSVLYFIAAFTVFGIRHAGTPSPLTGASPLRDAHNALKYVLQSPIVGGLILLSIMPFLFGLTINSLLPAFNTDILKGGPDTLGTLMTGMGAGAIVGSLLLARLGGIRHKGFWLFLSGTGWGLSLMAFAVTSSLAWSMAAIASLGFVSAVNMSMNRSLVQLQVDQSMRGRVMSIDLMSHGLMPIGLLPVSWIAEHYGVQAGLEASGIVLVLVTLALWARMPAVRRIDKGFAT